MIASTRSFLGEVLRKPYRVSALIIFTSSSLLYFIPSFSIVWINVPEWWFAFGKDLWFEGKGASGKSVIQAIYSAWLQCGCYTIINNPSSSLVVVECGLSALWRRAWDEGMSTTHWQPLQCSFPRIKNVPSYALAWIHVQSLESIKVLFASLQTPSHIYTFLRLMVMVIARRRLRPGRSLSIIDDSIISMSISMLISTI